MNAAQRQTLICEKYRAIYSPPNPNLKLGVSANFLSGKSPLNGLRHSPEDETCGWFLWAGEELSSADDFFRSIHVSHLLNTYPQIIPFLALPPGWRFLIAGNYEDVWRDDSLLNLKS